MTSSVVKAADSNIDLSSKYLDNAEAAYLSGNQALIRLMVDQMRADRARGLRTQSFVTGYPGSPLGGLDIALHQARALLDEHGIKHLPGQNEELAATSLMGTQMVDDHPSAGIDGVVGYWYGKGPGIDRSGDALKHGNFAGTSRHGAVVILSGEDHEAKSSSVPYQQEFAFEHHGIPVLYPASVSEFIEFGRHAVEMSRYSGCWVALKLVASLCDGGEVVRLNPQQQCLIPELSVNGKPFGKTANFKFFPVTNIATERQLYVERHAAVRKYAAANQLDRIIVSNPADHIGILSAGRSYADTRQALADLGLGDAQMNALGIRLGKIGLLCPTNEAFLKEFASGLKLVIVIEEKRDFLERQVRAVLCDSEPVTVLGKHDAQGNELFPIEGGFASDLIAERLVRVLASAVIMPPTVHAYLDATRALTAKDWGAQPRRALNFCSGCPHNVSTKLAEGQVAWGAPGCHIFAALMEAPTRRIEAVTQLGGEGLPWIGLAPFTARRHIVQNLGDGALMHSSYQNIRFAVTAGVNITFKILFNGVIANTGGQVSIGAPSVVDLVRHLALEGVRRIVLIAREPERYRGVKMPAKVEIRSPDAIEVSMAELSSVEGVTILIYDGECANERRRRQKRGRAPPPALYTVVQEDICENCGDCGRKSNCMSLQKVPTPFGPKTQIHQSSCNQDRACVEGECPSFVTVEVAPGVKRKSPAAMEIDVSAIPDRSQPPGRDGYSVYIPGVGGTGVLTVNAILAQAAALDGSEVKSYDQTGAAQKWGAVLSCLVLSDPGFPVSSNRVGVGKANLYLALDLLAGVDRTNLSTCRPGTTCAVINADVLPSGEMVRNPDAELPVAAMQNTIRAATNGVAARIVEARRIAEGLFGDYMMANMVAVGVAHQAGWLPISAANIETAITLNAVKVGENITAFRAGRLAIHDARRLEQLVPAQSITLADRASDSLRNPSVLRHARELMAQLPMVDAPQALHDAVMLRIADLIEYQSVAYAAEYTRTLARFISAERAIGDAALHRFALSMAVARGLHKLMAYKDEYEVARLLLQRTFDERVRAMFTGPVRLRFQLQPPLLRDFGMRRKLAVGTWIKPLLSVLNGLRCVRGSAFDPFGRLPARREERAILAWYRQVLDDVLPLVGKSDSHSLVQAAALADDIRGYEHVKSRNFVLAKERYASLQARLRPDAAMPAFRRVIALVAEPAAGA